MHTVNYSLRCIIHYDRNVMEKEVGRLTEASFSTIWQSADVRQTRENIALRLDNICKTLPSHFNSEIQCSHKWCYRQFTNISRMLKIKHLTGEQTEERNQLQHLGHQPGVPRKKKVDCYFHRKNAFLCGKGRKKQGVIHRWFVVVADRACWGSNLRTNQGKVWLQTYKLKEKLVNFFGKKYNFGTRLQKWDCVLFSSGYRRSSWSSIWSCNFRKSNFRRGYFNSVDTSKLHSQEISWLPSSNFLILA